MLKNDRLEIDFIIGDTVKITTRKVVW